MRIRTIKPSFWSSSTIASVSRDARLTFIGLWNIADDEGRLLGGAKALAGLLFEHDDDVGAKEIGAWVGELETAGLVERYEVKGVSYLLIPGFGEHQKIDKRFPSRLPPPVGGKSEGSRGEVGGKSGGLSDFPPGSDDSSENAGGKSASEVGRWKVEGGIGSGSEEAAARHAPTPPPTAAPSPSPLPSPSRTPRMKRGLLGDDERAAEPKTVREFLARAYDYPHQPAKEGELSFGDVLRRDLTVFGDRGELSLERAIEIGGWAHWQSADARDASRWVWPAQAPGKLERWVRDDAAKALSAAAAKRRAEAQGIDLAKPLPATADPTRAALAKVHHARLGRGEDLPPAATWIDEVITQGRAEEELEAWRSASPAAAAGDAKAVATETASRDAKARAAYDAYVASIPPQERARSGTPDWSLWVRMGRPRRFTGGSGAAAAPSTTPPQSPSTSTSSVNQPPSDVDGPALLSAVTAKLATPAPPPARRVPPAVATSARRLTSSELAEMRAHSPESRLLADELEREYAAADAAKAGGAR